MSDTRFIKKGPTFNSSTLKPQPEGPNQRCITFLASRPRGPKEFALELLALRLRGVSGSAARGVVVRRAPSPLLVHGWDRIKNVNAYSLLALSTHKNVKYYPTMTKLKIQKSRKH